MKNLSRPTNIRGYGLIGYPLTHSFSKQYFTRKFARESLFDCYYENFPIESIDQLPDLINRHADLEGLNVTIPYKEKIIALLDKLDEESHAIGAVNTVKIIRSQETYRLNGYNTDAYGFYTSIKPVLKSWHKNALILGTGGASKAVAFALKKLNISMTFVSRHPHQQDHISYPELSGGMLSDYQIIVNTSPLGMYPNTGSFPGIPYQDLSPRHILYDLIYNPEETLFLKKGKSMGAAVMNGLEMLHLQAERAWEIWNYLEL